MTVTVSAPRAAASVWLSGYQAGRARFPPRPALAAWPATRQSREQVRQARQRARPAPAPGYRRESLDVLFGTASS